MPTMTVSALWVAALLLAAIMAPRALRRLQLSRAKHLSLTGHGRIARRIARQIPYYSYDRERFFACDGAPATIVSQRKFAFERLASDLQQRAPRSIGLSESLEPILSDVRFTANYRVPFQFREHLRREIPTPCVLRASRGTQVEDLDGNWAYDLAGSYGVNLFGYDFYKRCINQGAARVAELGPVLGAYHPLVRENVERLQRISGLDEVSFHMSGTEAVMQAVRLARYHTRRPRAVVFCGAYHGWWDGVQPGLGNPRRVNDLFVLSELSERTLRVLETRRDIACVLVNPLQALHPNAAAPSDGALVDASRSSHYDRAAYTDWLRRLREVCTRRSIVLIFDEVFLGFRLALGGAQEYFGVRADLVTYGKTLGGGLPIGALCGRSVYMKRYRDDRPTDICFARGTFNSHPYVMATMNEFLRHLDTPEAHASYERLTDVWDTRARAVNDALAAAGMPVRVANLVSIWTVLYQCPSRYNWMFQFYLRREGLALSWIGTGRLIFSHNYTEADLAAVTDKIVRAARAMEQDGWWWANPNVGNRDVRRGILRELILARLRRERSQLTPESRRAPSSQV